MTTLIDSPAYPAITRSRTPVVSLAWMLARPGATGPATLVLPIVAFAVTTALVSTVVGGTLMFFSWDSYDAGVYQLLSVIALVLLVIPLATVGGAAARLSARRRDDRLSTLRLLGANTSTVRAIAIVESSALALVGSLAGMVLFLLITPLVGMIPFGGGPIGATALWMNPLILVGIVLAMVVLSIISAVIGLQSVSITPLGVRTKQQAPRISALRIVIGIALVVVALTIVGMTPDGIGIVGLSLFFGAPIAIAVGVLAFVGPWALSLYGKSRLKRAKTAEALLAARGILESPKAAWRSVSGIAMTSFVAVVAGSGMSLLALVPAGEGTNAEGEILIADIRTGILVTLAASFVMIACSVGISQAAAILDRKTLYRSLDWLGMPQSSLEKSRAKQIMGPLLFVSLGSALLGVILVLPMVGALVVLSPVAALTIIVTFVIGFALVWAAVRATRPVLSSVLQATGTPTL